MWMALNRAGEPVGRGHVERLMRVHGIEGAKRRGKPWGRPPRISTVRAPDLVERDFTATAPDELWVADFTYLRCWAGVVFFASSSTSTAAGSSAGSSPPHAHDLVEDALRMALSRRDGRADAQPIYHSDAGSQPGLKGSSQHLDVRGGDGRGRPGICVGGLLISRGCGLRIGS